MTSKAATVVVGQGYALPPHDLEAEKAVLGAAMLAPQALTATLPLLKPEHFFRTSHQQIWAAIATLAMSQEPCDEVSVASLLIKRGQLAEVGGHGALALICADVATVIGIEHWAKEVRRCADLRAIIVIGQHLATAAFAQEKSPDELVSRGFEQLRAMMAGKSEGWSSLGELILAREAQLMAFITDIEQVERGISTGWPSVDDMLMGGGLGHGKLHLFGGLSSMGKSTFMRAMGYNIARQGIGVALLSLEQTKDEVVEEMIFSQSGVNQQYQVRTNTLLNEAQERRFMEQLGIQGALPFWVDDEAGISPSMAFTKLEKLRADRPEVRVAMLDYAQIFRADHERSNSNDAAKFESICGTLRDIAKHTDLAIGLGVQFTKEGMDGKSNPDYRPKLNHIRGGSLVYQMAYVILGLFRPDYLFERGILPLDQAPPECLGITSAGQPFYRRSNVLEVHAMKQQRSTTAVAELLMDVRTRQIVDPATENGLIVP